LCHKVNPLGKAPMFKISIFYPHHPDRRFDMDYYLNTHMPLSIKLLSAHPGFKGVSVERGVGGGAPGSDPTYVAMCHFLFDSVENFLAAFMPNSPVLQGDMPNYTDIASIIQISEVALSQ
jgi:uncharacterized protein (TIGR02118 family)